METELYILSSKYSDKKITFSSILNREKFVIKAWDVVKDSKYGKKYGTREIYFQEKGAKEIFLTEHYLDDNNLYICNDRAFVIINFNKSTWAMFSLYGSCHISLLFDIKRKTFLAGTKKALYLKFIELFPEDDFDNTIILDSCNLNIVYKGIQMSTLRKLKK